MDERSDPIQYSIVTKLWTGTEVSGARFHRAEHVKNVLHVGKTTVISAPVLIDKTSSA